MLLNLKRIFTKKNLEGNKPSMGQIFLQKNPSEKKTKQLPQPGAREEEKEEGRNSPGMNDFAESPGEAPHLSE